MVKYCQTVSYIVITKGYYFLRYCRIFYSNTSLAAPGALAHRLQRRTACNTSQPNLSKMADRARKYVKPYVIEPSDKLLLNKFFDPSTPSKRIIEPPAKSKMAARGTRNGRRGLERGPILGY